MFTVIFEGMVNHWNNYNKNNEVEAKKVKDNNLGTYKERFRESEESNRNRNVSKG